MDANEIQPKQFVKNLLSKLAVHAPMFGRVLAPAEKELIQLFRELKKQKFTGTFQVNIRKGKVSVKLVTKYPKDKMMLVYAKYAGFFESKRNEYIRTHHSEYGADKFAVEETKREMELKEKMEINSINLKQAMTRAFERRPLRTRKID